MTALDVSLGANGRAGTAVPCSEALNCGELCVCADPKRIFYNVMKNGGIILKD